MLRNAKAVEVVAHFLETPAKTTFPAAGSASSLRKA